MSDDKQAIILEFVRSLSSASGSVQVDTDLIETGALDSLSVLDLVAFFERSVQSHDSRHRYYAGKSSDRCGVGWACRGAFTMSGGRGPGSAEELRIAPLTIDPDVIARFISDVYDSHPHGKSFVPRWSGSFLKHLIFDHPDFTPDHALGAFVGERLVSLILAQPYDVRLGGERRKGVFGSWLATNPEGVRHFATIKIIGELRERLKARGVDLMMGVAYRSGPGVGLDFWEGFGRAFPKDMSKGRDLTFWARVLDGKALARAVNDSLLKFGGHAARLRPVLEPRNDPDIRQFVSGDLGGCQQLLAEVPVEVCSVPSAWEFQCASDLATGPQTLVSSRDGRVEGLSMFHVLPMSDAGPLKVGMIDHLVARGGRADQGRLLAATLWRLKQGGACLALVPKKPGIGALAMVARGFVPYSAQFKIFLLPLSERVEPVMPGSFDLYVR